MKNTSSRIADPAELLSSYYDLADLKGEKWKDVVGFEGLYKVSNKGRVKSCSRVINSGGKYQRTIKERIRAISPIVNKRRVKDSDIRTWVLTLSKDKKLIPANIHRLVFEAFVGVPDSTGDDKTFYYYTGDTALLNDFNNYDFRKIVNRTKVETLRENTVPTRRILNEKVLVELNNLWINKLMTCEEAVDALREEYPILSEFKTESILSAMFLQRKRMRIPIRVGDRAKRLVDNWNDTSCRGILTNFRLPVTIPLEDEKWTALVYKKQAYYRIRISNKGRVASIQKGKKVQIEKIKQGNVSASGLTFDLYHAYAETFILNKPELSNNILP